MRGGKRKKKKRRQREGAVGAGVNYWKEMNEWIGGGGDTADRHLSWGYANWCGFFLFLFAFG